MTINDIKKLLNKDEYLKIALKEYMKFRNSDKYGETYKYDILTKMNEYIKKQKITEKNIAQIIEYYQKENPKNGTFVDWRELDNLKKFTLAKPEETSDLLIMLFDETIDIEERVKKLYLAVKDDEKDIRLGTSLFGYLLAGYDYTKYPLYKGSIYDNFVSTFGLNPKGRAYDRYTHYYKICECIMEYFKKEGILDSPTMLDAQDFIYCTSEYTDLKLKIGLKYVQNLGKELKSFKDDTQLFLTTIKEQDKEYLKELRDEFKAGEKINKIRFEIIDKILKATNINLDDIERLKTDVNKQFTTNILQAWNNFTILYPLYYNQYKIRVNIELKKILEEIKKIAEVLDTSNESFGETINDFMWKQNFGSTECWIALYPERRKSHKTAAQLFLSISDENIRYGLAVGSELDANKLKEEFETINNPDEFSHDKFKNQLTRIHDKYKKINKNNYWLFNVFYKKKEVWEYCKKKNCFAMQYEYDVENNASVTRNINVAKEVREGDYAIAYTGNQKIIGLGRVTKEYYVEENKKEYIFEDSGWAQRIGVDWKAVVDKPIYIEKFNNNLGVLETNKLPIQAINIISEKGYDFAKKTMGGVDIEVEIVDTEIIPTIDFTKTISFNNLIFENDDIVRKQIHTALRNGKHIILVGPPGTGKSKLAKEIANSYDNPYIMTTANSDWSTFDTIGGYKPDIQSKLFFNEGIFLSCFKDRHTMAPLNKWLIIDEINRADIDKAFGSLFSALTGDMITLSYQSKSDRYITIRPQGEDTNIIANDYEYIIPNDFRIIATMNTFDKASLYEMSYAFMRRFAFIYIGIPKNIDKGLIESLLKVWNIKGNIDSISLANLWTIINKYRKVGPAIVEDIARYVALDSDFTSALILYVLPQFEGLGDNEIKSFINEIKELDAVHQKSLISFIEDFFGIEELDNED